MEKRLSGNYTRILRSILNMPFGKLSQIMLFIIELISFLKTDRGSGLFDKPFWIILT